MGHIYSVEKCSVVEHLGKQRSKRSSFQSYILLQVQRNPKFNSDHTFCLYLCLSSLLLTQGWNPGLPHCRWILYQLSYKGSPRILELTQELTLELTLALQADSLPAELTGNPSLCYPGLPLKFKPQVVIVVKNQPTHAGDIKDLGSVSGLGRSPRGEHGNPTQFSCLENPMDSGACQATVQRIAKSWTQMKQFNTHARLSTLFSNSCLLYNP